MFSWKTDAIGLIFSLPFRTFSPCGAINNGEQLSFPACSPLYCHLNFSSLRLYEAGTFPTLFSLPYHFSFQVSKYLVSCCHLYCFQLPHKLFVPLPYFSCIFQLWYNHVHQDTPHNPRCESLRITSVIPYMCLKIFCHFIYVCIPGTLSLGSLR